MELHCKCRLLSFPVNRRLGWKRQTMTNTLAYFATELTTAVKSYMLQAQRLCGAMTFCTEALTLMALEKQHYQYNIAPSLMNVAVRPCVIQLNVFALHFTIKTNR